MLALASSVGDAAPLRLPAPITIDAGTRSFEIERDGHVRGVRQRGLPFPRGAAAGWFAARRIP